MEIKYKMGKVVTLATAYGHISGGAEKRSEVLEICPAYDI